MPPCRYGRGCLRLGCFYLHPGGRVIDEPGAAAVAGSTPWGPRPPAGLLGFVRPPAPQSPHAGDKRGPGLRSPAQIIGGANKIQKQDPPGGPATRWGLPAAVAGEGPGFGFPGGCYHAGPASPAADQAGAGGGPFGLAAGSGGMVGWGDVIPGDPAAAAFSPPPPMPFFGGEAGGGGAALVGAAAAAADWVPPAPPLDPGVVDDMDLARWRGAGGPSRPTEESPDASAYFLRRKEMPPDAKLAAPNRASLHFRHPFKLPTQPHGADLERVLRGFVAVEQAELTVPAKCTTAGTVQAKFQGVTVQLYTTKFASSGGNLSLAGPPAAVSSARLMVVSSPWFVDAAVGGGPAKRASKETAADFYLPAAFAGASAAAGLRSLLPAAAAAGSAAAFGARAAAVVEHLGAVVPADRW